MPTDSCCLADGPCHLGIDLGGTKTEAIVLDDSGNCLGRWRMPSPRGDYVRTLAMLRTVYEDACEKYGLLSSVGVGIPGCVSRETGLVKNANSTWLIGHPLLVDLQSQFSCPVTIANDADCFALSEAMDGAGAEAATVWGIILGTGTGSGIVIHGNLLQGPNSIAGEWGHNPLPAMTEDEVPGPLCYCGRHGCIETFLSGPGMVQDHCRRGGDATCVEAIVDAAAKGEATATATLQRYVERLARATASVINILDPDVIVLGGGVSNIPDLYDRVPALWSRYVFSDTVRTRLLPPRHGDSSGVRGAAWLGVSNTVPGKICRPR